MITKCLRASVVAIALAAMLCVSSNVNAQCCGGATTAFYQPTAYTAYSPVAYTTYNTGWYPGYFLDRIRTRLWGAPTTFVAAQPTAYVASYPSTYVASYPTYAASYPSCSTCAPAAQVTLRPVSSACCDTCSSPCSSCSSSAAYGVSQMSYQEPSGCACNGGSATSGPTIVVPNGTVVTPGTQQAPSNGASQPQLPETFETTPRSTERPLNENLEPEPAGNNGSPAEGTPNGTTNNSGAFFEAPELFSPKDRAAQNSITPMKLAVYEQPVRHHSVSATRVVVTPQEAERDATGWRSASN